MKVIVKPAPPSVPWLLPVVASGTEGRKEWSNEMRRERILLTVVSVPYSLHAVALVPYVSSLLPTA